MRNVTLWDDSNILAQQRHCRVWRKIVSMISCVMVFCMICALILPAFSVEMAANCENQEHTHTENCYTQVVSDSKTVLTCTPESLSIHRHSDDCLDGNGRLCCGEADFVVHMHDGSCYDENGELWCAIPEKKAHTHSESCYEIPETHIHGEDCYQNERGELICLESTEPAHTHGEGCYSSEKCLTCTLEESEGHAHSESCYGETSTLICTRTETAEHWHGEGCYDESGTFICTLTESEGHLHGEGCYEISSILTCTQEESEGHAHSEDCYESVLTCTESTEPAHVHTDECYAWNAYLTCTEPTNPAEPVLTCEKEEILLHEHSGGCFETDEDGSLCLSCGQVQILEHIHTEGCFQTVEEPADAEALTCQLEGSEDHHHSALCSGIQPLNADLSVQSSSTEGADPSGQSAPLNAPSTPTGSLALQDYITGAKLFYRVSPDANWHQVDASKELPGNAELKLEISYEDVSVDALENADFTLTYDLPLILRSPTGSGTIYDTSKNPMGEMTVEDTKVTMTFDPEWITNHHKPSGNEGISGKFDVMSQIDLTLASQTPSTTITIGPANIGLRFEPDIIAKHADVTLRKSDAKVVQDAMGDYLEYQLAITAGQDGAPSVVVKDAFRGEDQPPILGYVGISTPAGSGNGPAETGVPADGQPGQLSMDADGTTMVWDIGDMAAGETRTLTYRVKLDVGYLGGLAKDAVTNTATPFCGEYGRDSTSSTFTPKADVTMSKAAGNYTPNSDGNGGTIEYTILIQADKDNNYTLKNVKIWDALDGSLKSSYATADAYLPHLSYVEDSFKLAEGGSLDQNGAIVKPGEGNPVTPVFQTKQDGSTNNYCLFCDAGTLAPGESKTLTYTVNVGPGVFSAAGNNTPKVRNWAQTRAGDPTNGSPDVVKECSTYKDINKKVWSSKGTGRKQDTEATVSMSGNAYENPTAASLAGITLPDPAEFTAPAGSFLYTVTVNRAADWDVSNASMTDLLDSQYSQYIGYVRVDAYDKDPLAVAKPAPIDTVWLKVDGKKSFFFKPSSVGWSGSLAYQFTYYTQVNLGDNVTQTDVVNEFTMNGEVGIGGNTFPLPDNGVTVTATNAVQGSNSFSLSKRSWYYEPSQVSSGEYANGTMYWYIQVDGKVIPAGTYLRDVTSYNAPKMYLSSLVGLYTGNLGGESISGYDDLEHLRSSGKLTTLDESYHSTPEISYYKDSYGRSYPIMTVQLTQDVTLNGSDSLFLIVRTEPKDNPAGLGDGPGQYHTYKNRADSSYDGNDWFEGNDQTMVLYNSNGISKTLEEVRAWKGGTAASDPLSGLKGGTYAIWNVQLNRTGRLSGSYWVEERIPEGMELAYVERSGVGTGYSAAAPSCVQMSPGAGWLEHTREVDHITTYYYTNGQTVRWYVTGLKTDHNMDPKKNLYNVDFRVVCRVTDTDVLMNGKTKEFRNHVDLIGKGGEVIDSSSSTVSLQSTTLSKIGTYEGAQDKTKYPFEITVNPLGEDLVPGTDSLSLVDTMSNTLKLDIDSIQVKKSGTDTLITDWSAAVDGQTLILTLPDKEALTVTYSAWINAKPGDTISISNNAHWEGCASTSLSKVDNDNFEFRISSVASAGELPSIKITKRNADNSSVTLGGAEFSLATVVVQGDGTIAETNPWTGTTTANGELIFGGSEHQPLHVDTIYCLRETKAPDGFVLDNTPHYFVIAKRGTDGNYPTFTFPEDLHIHYSDENGPEYSYQATNHRGRITVQKKFLDPGGKNDCPPIAGTYKFGLYDTVDSAGHPNGNMLQSIFISYSSMDREYKTAVFRDLELSKTYYVFELDDNDHPISGGGILSDRFEVRYGGGNSATPTEEESSQTVTVTNRICTPELPETGGIGTTVFYGVGLLLLAGAAMLLLTKKRVRAGT